MTPKTFCTDESGVVTVDWSVLAAAAMGMALATAGLINLTREDLSDQIDAEFAGGSIATGDTSTWEEASGEPIVLIFADFTNGAEGWEGGRSEYVEGFGDIMGRYAGGDGNEQVRSTFQLQDGYEYAVMTFDFLAIDSWDHETFSIFVDGTAVASQQVHWRSENENNFEFDQESGNIFATVDVFERDQIGGHTRFTDQTFRITMVVRRPGETLSIGFGADTNSNRSDESWGLDNFSLVQTNAHGEAENYFDD